MKHLEDRQKYSAARHIFNSLLGVASGDKTLCLMLDILLLPSSTHRFFESTEMKTQLCHLLFHFFSSLFFCLFFSLSPSAFTFKGHNSLMKSISPKRRLKLKTKSSNGIPSTSLNMLIKCTLNEFFVRPSVQRHPSAVAVSHE